MNIVINSSINKKKWQNLLEKSAFANPFNSPEYFNFYNSVAGFSAHAFGVEDDGELKALVCATLQKEKGLKSYFSRRAIIYGGPVVSENGRESLAFLLQNVVHYFRKNAIYLEIRNYFNYSAYYQDFTKAGFAYTPWLNFHLQTDNLQKVKKNMSNSRWRQINSAIKAGAFWREAQSEEEVSRFYNILALLYRTKIKKPLLSEEFFLEFYRQKMGKYLFVFLDEIVIGGIMCPILPQKSIYEFYVCGLDQEYKNLYPSVMATWAAIEYASINGINTFDFMGAGSPDEAYGVREFKARFGGEQIEHGRYLKVLNPALYAIGKAGLFILSKIKL